MSDTGRSRWGTATYEGTKVRVWRNEGLSRRGGSRRGPDQPQRATAALFRPAQTSERPLWQPELAVHDAKDVEADVHRLPDEWPHDGVHGRADGGRVVLVDLDGVREDVVLGDVHRLGRVLCALLVDRGHSHGLVSGSRTIVSVSIGGGGESVSLPK